MTSRSGEPVGDLRDEASRLLTAAEHWWREARSQPAAPAGEERSAHAGPECAICPFCQLMSMLRHARPEVFEHLSAAGTALMHAARATFETADGGWAARDGGPAVERIDIR